MTALPSSCRRRRDSNNASTSASCSAGVFACISLPTVAAIARMASFVATAASSCCCFATLRFSNNLSENNLSDDFRGVRKLGRGGAPRGMGRVALPSWGASGGAGGRCGAGCGAVAGLPLANSAEGDGVAVTERGGEARGCVWGLDGGLRRTAHWGGGRRRDSERLAQHCMRESGRSDGGEGEASDACCMWRVVVLHAFGGCVWQRREAESEVTRRAAEPAA